MNAFHQTECQTRPLLRAGSALLIVFLMMKLDKPAVSFASHTSATTLHGSPVMPS